MPIGTQEQDATMCGACGAFAAAAWTLWVESDRLDGHRACFRLCEAHYRRLMDHMMGTPDHDPLRPLRGYT